MALWQNFIPFPTTSGLLHGLVLQIHFEWNETQVVSSRSIDNRYWMVETNFLVKILQRPYTRLSIIMLVKLYNPFNPVFISETTKIRTPWTVTDRPLYLSSC